MRARQHVHMEVVVADMPPRGSLEALLGERRAVESDHVVQALVGNGHVAPQLGDGGIGAPPLVDEHVDALGHGMAEERERLAVDRGTRDPGALRVATGFAENLGKQTQIGHDLVFVRAMQFDVKAAERSIVLGGEVGQGGERSTGGLGALQDIQGYRIEILERRHVRKPRPHRGGRVKRGLLVRKKAARSPYNRRCGHKR